MKIIDEKTALSQIGDRDFFYELIYEILDEFDERVKKLEYYSRQHDFENLTRTAHSFKGVSSNLYLIEISLILKEIEFNAYNKNEANYEEMLEKLARARHRLIEHMKTLKH